MKAGLTRIGPSHREEHFHLKPEHRCYYWGEYTAWNFTRGLNSAYSETNRLIADLKFVPGQHPDPEGLARKSAAIDLISEAFARFWHWSELGPEALLVPMPTSRAATDPAFDDRMDRVVRGIVERSGCNLQLAKLLESDGSLQSSHASATRPKLRQLLASIRVNDEERPPHSPRRIFLFDDVLTTGAHFVACSDRLRSVFPGALVIGTFVARTARPSAGPL